jgi:hypothetical protein
MRAEIDRAVTLALSRPWRIPSWLVIAVFGLIALAPMALQIAGAAGSGAAENRVLAPAPRWEDLKRPLKLSRLLETYVNDHFGLRDRLVRLNAVARHALGVSSNPQVAIGRDGWLFYTAERIMEQHTGQDVFTPAELERWVAQMQADRDWLARRGIPFFIVLAPDKNTIYPEMIPQYPHPPGTVTRADQVAARLKGTAIPFIDPRAAIIAAKAQHPDIYPKGDSHWGPRAALIAYDMLMAELKPKFPTLEQVRLDDFTSRQGGVPGDLLYLMGLHGDVPSRGEILTSTLPEHILRTEPVPKLPGWGWPMTLRVTDRTQAPRAVIFGDSFTDYVLGPMALYGMFRESVFTHHNLANFNFTLVDGFKPDLVVYVVAERYLKTIPLQPFGF